MFVILLKKKTHTTIIVLLFFHPLFVFPSFSTPASTEIFSIGCCEAEDSSQTFYNNRRVDIYQSFTIYSDSWNRKIKSILCFNGSKHAGYLTSVWEFYST